MGAKHSRGLGAKHSRFRAAGGLGRMAQLRRVALRPGGLRCQQCNKGELVVQRVIAGLACPCCEGNDQTQVVVPTVMGLYALDPIRSVTVVVACQACAAICYLFLDLAEWVAGIGVNPDQLDRTEYPSPFSPV